jgi:hypothetical protein
MTNYTVKELFWFYLVPEHLLDGDTLFEIFE